MQPDIKISYPRTQADVEAEGRSELAWANREIARGAADAATLAIHAAGVRENISALPATGADAPPQITTKYSRTADDEVAELNAAYHEPPADINN
jgi:hypothetical protein